MVLSHFLTYAFKHMVLSYLYRKKIVLRKQFGIHTVSLCTESFIIIRHQKCKEKNDIVRRIIIVSRILLVNRIQHKNIEQVCQQKQN